MDTVIEELLTAFELHSVDRLQTVLDGGLDVRSEINGMKPVNLLIEMYLRSDRFPDCFRLLMNLGAVLEDPKLAPVLLNDPDALAVAVQHEPALLQHRTTLFSAFTRLSALRYSTWQPSTVT